MTDYLTVAEVLAMHADQIERYGGSHGVRDPGLLEAALYRPQTGYYVDLIEEAAALLGEPGPGIIPSRTVTSEPPLPPLTLS